jgi:hydroxyacylglutathione hydrolase
MKIAIIPVTPYQQNCSVLWDEATMTGVVVDPGGDVPRILAELQQLGVTVERIVLTHGHIDHAAGAAELKEALGGIPVEGPDERDRFLLDGLAEQGRAMGLTGARNVTPDRWLHEGDTVDLAGVPFEVLHCPGHTPGHVVFVNKAAKFALVGDVLFRGSVGRTDFPYCSTDDLMTAIHDKLLPLGDDVRFLCGHGPASSIGEERRSNPFLQ